jgi:hypothetical protein
MLDLSQKNFSVSAEAGFEFELKLPTGEATGAFVTVRGEQSKIVKQYGRRKFSEMQMKEQAAKRRGKEVEPMSLDDIEELSVESAIVRIIGWKGITNAGKEVPFSKEAATEILKEHSWIREQVMEESNNLHNFRPE